MTRHSIRMILTGLVAAGLLTAIASPRPAAAQITRCERPDGTSVYSDRRCSDIGAVERLPRANHAGSRRIYRGGCARNLQDLMFELTTAIDSGDANRLASVYHWAGMSSRAAGTVMARLDSVARRPLIDIVPVLPTAPASLGGMVGVDVGVDVGGNVDAASSPAGATAALAASGPAVPVRGYYYPSTVEADPVALRVVQTLGNGSTPSETVFDLHQYFGCLWIKG